MGQVQPVPTINSPIGTGVTDSPGGPQWENLARRTGEICTPDLLTPSDFRAQISAAHRGPIFARPFRRWIRSAKRRSVISTLSGRGWVAWLEAFSEQPARFL